MLEVQQEVLETDNRSCLSNMQYSAAALSHVYKVVTFCVDNFHYHAVHALQIVDY